MTTTPATDAAEPPAIRIAECDPEAPEARACLAAYLQLLVERIPDIDPGHVPVPDPKASAYRRPDGLFLIATTDAGAALGCGSFTRLHSRTGEVKRLWVAPVARGLGLARRLMAAIEDAARGDGLTLLKLDTNEALPEAISFYRATGWRETAAYTPYPATHWFEKPL